MKFEKKLLSLSAMALAMVATTPAFAAVDLTPITGAFTPSDVVTGVMSVGSSLAVIYVTMKGARIVLGMIRGA